MLALTMRRLIALLLLTASPLLAACGGGDSEPATPEESALSTVQEFEDAYTARDYASVCEQVADDYEFGFERVSGGLPPDLYNRFRAVQQTDFSLSGAPCEVYAEIMAPAWLALFSSSGELDADVSGNGQLAVVQDDSGTTWRLSEFNDGWRIATLPLPTEETSATRADILDNIDAAADPGPLETGPG